MGSEDLKPDAPSTRGALWVLSTLSALFSAGYGVLFTIIADYRDDYGISATTTGWIIGIGFIIAFFTQVIVGPLGDRGHARSMILGGAALNCIGLLMMGFGTTAVVLLGGRIVTGIAIGTAAPAIKRIVVVGSGEHLGRNLGRLFSADVFGFAMGPVISAFLVGPFGIPAPFIVIATLTLIMVTVSRRVTMPEHATNETESAPSQRLAFDLLRDRSFAGAVVLGSGAFAMVGSFDALWDIVHKDLDSPEWMANLGIALFALPLVLLGPLSGKLAQSFGPFKLAFMGLMLGACFMSTYGFLTIGGAIFAVAMVHALGDGFTFAASGVAVGMTAPEERQAGAQGVLGGMQALTAGVMAPMVGWLYEHFGQAAAYWTAGATIGGMALLGLWLAGPAVRGIGDRAQAASSHAG